MLPVVRLRLMVFVVAGNTFDRLPLEHRWTRGRRVGGF